jgi:hypothetical protein
MFPKFAKEVEKKLAFGFKLLGHHIPRCSQVVTQPVSSSAVPLQGGDVENG